MSGIGSELAALAYFIVVGWVALWPARNRLGAFGYHIAALPAGLLAAPIAAVVTTLAGRPLDILSAAAGAVLLVAGVWAVSYLVLAREEGSDRPRVGIASFAAATGIAGVLGIFLGLARFTVANADSYVSYWPLGIELVRKGALNLRVFSSRAQLLPSMSAIQATFGSDWGYVVYPVVAVTLLAWLAFTLWTGPLSGATRRTKALVSGAAALFLVLEPSFLFHSVFVHSHMLTAFCLLAALTSIWLAARPGSHREPGELEAAYLVVAGIFTAGLALTRTDGPAYQFVIIAAAIAALTASRVRWRGVAAYFGPLLFIVLTVFASGFIKLGMWTDAKLSGKPAAAILAVLVLSAVGPWIVQALDRVLPFRVSGERFLELLVSAAAGLTLVVFVLKWDSARLALSNARINLFQGFGGYSYLWYAVVLIVVISLFSGDALRRGSWTHQPFLTIALFFVIVALVHGTSHSGRIGVGDSMNRVVFHSIPLIVWYAAAIVARILNPAEKTRADNVAHDTTAAESALEAEPAE